MINKVNIKRLNKSNYPSQFTDLSFESSIYDIIKTLNDMVDGVNITIADVEAFKVELLLNWEEYKTAIDLDIVNFKALVNKTITDFTTNMTTDFETFKTQINEDILTFKTSINKTVTDFTTKMTTDFNDYKIVIDDKILTFETSVNKTVTDFKTEMTTDFETFKTNINLSFTNLNNSFVELKKYVEDYLKGEEFLNQIITAVNDKLDSPEFTEIINQAILSIGFATDAKAGIVKPSGISGLEMLNDGIISIRDRGIIQDKLTGDYSDSFLAINSITNRVIGFGVVQGANIEDGTITSANIGDESIIGSKIQTEAINTRLIENKSVTAEKIQDNAITKSKILNGAVTWEKIEDNAIDNDKLDIDSVRTANIVNGAVTANKIAEGSVDNFKLATNAVSAIKLEDLCVTTAKLGNDSVTNAKIVNTAITADKFVNGALLAQCLKWSTNKENNLNLINSSDTVAKLFYNHYYNNFINLHTFTCSISHSYANGGFTPAGINFDFPTQVQGAFQPSTKTDSIHFRGCGVADFTNNNGVWHTQPVSVVISTHPQTGLKQVGVSLYSPYDTSIFKCVEIYFSVTFPVL